MTGGQTRCKLSCTAIQSLYSYIDFNGNFFEWCSLLLKLLRVRVSFSCIHSDSSVLLAELGRPSIEFLISLILHFMYFSELRPVVNFSDMWKSHEEFRLLIQQSFESVTQLSFHQWLFFSVLYVVSSASKLFMNDFVSALWTACECVGQNCQFWPMSLLFSLLRTYFLTCGIVQSVFKVKKPNPKTGPKP